MCIVTGYSLSKCSFRWVSCYCCLIKVAFGGLSNRLWEKPTPHTVRFPCRCHLQWPENASSLSIYDAGWRRDLQFFWTRSRIIFLLKGGPTGRLPASCMSFLSNAAGGLSIKKTQGNLWLLKEIPSACSRAQRRPFVPRHVSHTFRAQISSSFMKPRFIFAHCNVPVGSGNTGKHCRCTGNTPLPTSHTRIMGSRIEATG